MIKYVAWILRLIFPFLRYYPWILRVSRNPQKYPLAYRYNMVRLIAIKFLQIARVDVNVKNLPHYKPGQRYYIVGNHVSFLDPVVVVATHESPITFASKIEAAKFPIVGRILKILDCVFLERGNLKQEISMMQTIKKSLVKGDRSWAIFPEGTRNKDYFRELGEFKGGSFKLPVATNTTILPIAIWGTQTILPTRVFWRRYPVYIHYLPALDVAPFDGNTIKIAEHTRALIQNEVTQMRKDYLTQTKYYAKGKDFTQYLVPKD